MCGIAGWYRRGGRPVAEAALARACATIVHRGPDDQGLFAEDDFGFGMRRLSIIDLAGGHQPIFSPDRRFAIVYNGEIYNHPELRAELADWGWSFATHSDTETVLAAFARWGDDAWPRLEGMYGAAIWDRRDRRLTLARDPLGIKPLYYSLQRGGLAFGSEIRAIRALDGLDFTMDERAVHDFFMFGHVQKPRTIWNEVRTLAPGHLLHLGPERDPEVRRFWTPRFAVQEGLSEAEWIAETGRRVDDTVRRHMLADVTVGAFLSGGVDSSAVVAAMARHASAPVKAFTVGFPGTSIDETEAAARIARHLGCEHIVLPLEPQDAGVMLPQVQAVFDEPCAATAAVPVWHVSRLAAQHVKVVLCGEGADEIFAGYKRQRTALAAARMAPYLRLLDPLLAAIDRAPGLGSKRFNYLRQNARRFRQSALLESNYQRFFQGTQISTPWVREDLYEPGFHARQESDHPFADLEREYFGWPGARDLDPLDQFMLADLTVHMPSSLLNRTDRGSMAHSLEARVPFLSHKLVDWSLTMPRAMKLRGKVGKYALRKAVEPWLFPGALDDRKLGFQLPFAEWFSGGFATFAREAWSGSAASRSGYLRQDAVEKLFAEHAAGLANHGRILYAIAMFACWWEQTFAGTGPAREAAPC
ncbi:asparagine synthase (glutamine-hydrolyzing) [Novosphingobium album (ex Liu et al. 2023)]|uniref:asparagine synthase (glutamine-hydrolyzing) n=1 Tax=Novosphingobium album (ex Liu et al. 2023) TaxID=3031130 RepID=A0ABT5WV09_9SPHN|nr:asparagine synthase (glutamine-hydrolyzing) [Novosphingobium album (ex Liu et al. 2023)]MDE8653746.1 asparagine synthase (glutamine-hydrolyzing) [Novosphingobium album (ex Liu et al. 2023)]